MSQDRNDPKHGVANAPPGQVVSDDNRFAGRLSEHGSNRCAGGTVALAVNNSLLQPGCDTRAFQAVKRSCKSFLAAFGLCCAIAAPVHAGGISGQASVIDGDTIEIRYERIRLVTIDAPESRQTCLDAQGRTWRCGQQAALALSNLIARRPVSCRSEGTDRYARILGDCTVGGISLSAWLVENGWAIPYYDRNRRHDTAVRRAEAARRGIWSGIFEKPEFWRRQN